MPQGQVLSQSMRQEQVLSAQMLQKMALLTLPVNELQDTIRKEIQENPALEIPGNNSIGTTDDVPQQSANDTAYDDFSQSYGTDTADPDASDRKSAFIENSAREDVSLQSYLMQQLDDTDNLDKDVYNAAQVIITSLDANGFFTQQPLMLFEGRPETPQTVEAAVNLIRSFDPPGVCVRDYRESLILQAQRGGLEPDELELLTRMVRDHMEDLRPGRLASLARQLRADEEDVNFCFGFLKELNPFPGAGFADTQQVFVVPELSVHKVDGRLELNINRANAPDLSISEDFTSLASRPGLNPEEKNFLNTSIDRARMLISQVELRYQTLYKTALALMKLQRDFFLEGPSKLRPLTLKDVAAEVGVHETTISRISQAKWIETDWGLFQLKQFFTQGLTTRTADGGREEVSRNVVKDKIRAIIQSDTSGKKLSDQKISDLLAAQGIKVARRTVAKYRTELNLDSSYDR